MFFGFGKLLLGSLDAGEEFLILGCEVLHVLVPMQGGLLQESGPTGVQLPSGKAQRGELFLGHAQLVDCIVQLLGVALVGLLLDGRQELLSLLWQGIAALLQLAHQLLKLRIRCSGCQVQWARAQGSKEASLVRLFLGMAVEVVATVPTVDHPFLSL